MSFKNTARKMAATLESSPKAMLTKLIAEETWEQALV